MPLITSVARPSSASPKRASSLATTLSTTLLQVWKRSRLPRPQNPIPPTGRTAYGKALLRKPVLEPIGCSLAIVIFKTQLLYRRQNRVRRGEDIPLGSFTVHF